MPEASDRRIYRAEYVWSGGDVLEDASVEVEGGQIRDISRSPPDERDDLRDLGSVALVPGRVNAHSHAFQRAIRGRTEYLEAGNTEDDFWSWREAMYGAALALDPDAFEAVARFAFCEMLRAGWTTVGEFHYVHHDRDGEPYGDPNELAKRIVRAAASVGIDLTLLRAAYHRAGYEAESNPRQRRFREPDVDTYLRRVDALAEFVEHRDGVDVGLAPHSIRAVPEEWFGAIAEYAAARDLPVHVHASEQPGELQESRAEYGTTPIAALEAMGGLSKRTTVVHATHATETELGILSDRDCTVCACPTTERNLGDGFLPAAALMERNVPISVGTDSHIQIDPWEEMRLVEYHERLRERRRNVLAQYVEPAESSGRAETASALWPMGGSNGTRSLGGRPASLIPGDRANFVALDLEDPALAGATGESLPAYAVFSAHPGAVRDVFVGGERVIEGGSHPDGEVIREAFEDALRRVER